MNTRNCLLRNRKGLSYEKTACGFCWYGSAHCSDLYRVATTAPVWILPGMQLGRARKVRLPGLLQLEWMPTAEGIEAIMVEEIYRCERPASAFQKPEQGERQ